MIARRLTVAATLGALAVFAAGCGRDDGATASAPAGAALPAISISAPEHQASYPAEEDDTGSLTRRFDIRGTARAGEHIDVIARCQTGRCTAEATTNDDGRWATGLAIRTSASRPTVQITAQYAAGGALPEPAIIEVTLRAREERETTTTTTTATTKREPTEDEPGSHRDPAPTAPASGTKSPSSDPSPSQATGGSAPHRLAMFGDSLAVGTKPYLGGLLPGWDVTTDARTGRPLAEGMARLGAASLGSGPHVLGFSLFTNDGPSSLPALESAVRTSAQRAGSGGCAIWATIVAPPVGGRSYDAVNARLRELGASVPEVRIVDWAAAIREHPEWLAGDDVHGTPAGYRARAQLYARAAQSCGS